MQLDIHNRAAISACEITEQQTRSALKILERFPDTANALYEQSDDIMLVIYHGVSGQAPTHRTIFLIDDEGLVSTP